MFTELQKGGSFLGLAFCIIRAKRKPHGDRPQGACSPNRRESPGQLLASPCLRTMSWLNIPDSSLAVWLYCFSWGNKKVPQRHLCFAGLSSFLQASVLVRCQLGSKNKKDDNVGGKVWAKPPANLWGGLCHLKPWHFNDICYLSVS